MQSKALSAILPKQASEASHERNPSKDPSAQVTNTLLVDRGSMTPSRVASKRVSLPEISPFSRPPAKNLYMLLRLHRKLRHLRLNLQ